MAELPADSVATTRQILALLEAANWIDAQTRAVFVEFSLYYAPADLLLPARLATEVHPTGSMWTDVSLNPVALTVYTLENRWYLGVQIAGVVVAVAAMVWECFHLRTMRSQGGARFGSVRPSSDHVLAEIAVSIL